MDNCKSAAKSVPLSKSAPLNILKNGFYDTKKTVQLCADSKQLGFDTSNQHSAYLVPQSSQLCSRMCKAVHKMERWVSNSCTLGLPPAGCLKSATSPPHPQKSEQGVALYRARPQPASWRWKGTRCMRPI